MCNFPRSQSCQGLTREICTLLRQVRGEDRAARVDPRPDPPGPVRRSGVGGALPGGPHRAGTPPDRGRETSLESPEDPGADRASLVLPPLGSDPGGLRGRGGAGGKPATDRAPRGPSGPGRPADGPLQVRPDRPRGGPSQHRGGCPPGCGAGRRARPAGRHRGSRRSRPRLARGVAAHPHRGASERNHPLRRWRPCPRRDPRRPHRGGERPGPPGELPASDRASGPGADTRFRREDGVDPAARGGQSDRPRQARAGADGSRPPGALRVAARDRLEAGRIDGRLCPLGVPVGTAPEPGDPAGGQRRPCLGAPQRGREPVRDCDGALRPGRQDRVQRPCAPPPGGRDLGRSRDRTGRRKPGAPVGQDAPPCDWPSSWRSSPCRESARCSPTCHRRSGHGWIP